jgi:hypothetical protein
MASTNATNSARNNLALPFAAPDILPPELEKISCSTRCQNSIHPLKLVGKRIRVAELMEVEVGLCEGDALQSHITESTVLAVNIGSIEHGVASSLLLTDMARPNIGSYYANIADLTILDVLQ